MIRIDFNRNWKFTKQNENGSSIVNIPHDAMLTEDRKKENPSGSAGAYFTGGSYTYEKEFEVFEEWRDKHIVFRFEGIYQTAVIYINEKEASKVFYGYTSTDVSADEYLQYGEKNRIRIEVDNTAQPNSRWYSGAGLYRPVSMFVLDENRIELDGVKVETISYNPAKVHVTVKHTAGQPHIRMFDGECMVAEAVGDDVVLDIPDAKLWSAQEPNLYTCRVDLEIGGEFVDSVEERIGIRKVEWSPKGFFINGKETKLRGGCIHHDNGVLGACGYEEAEYRRIRIMKENGFNAVRSSHNPCTRAMLDACDELGMYMMDETWDVWYRHKSKGDYATYFMEHYEEDICSMVQKDYNHPSVVIYSIGNEVSEPATEEGREIEKRMVQMIHGLDTSRPVSGGFNLMIIANAAKGKQMYAEGGGLNSDGADMGDGEKKSAKPDMSQMNSTMFNMIAQQVGSGMNHSADSDEADEAISPAMDILDMAGYNYGSGRYPLDGEKHPDRIIFGSETLPPDIYTNWDMVKRYPYLIGDFMWTAWDYLGEAGLGAWTDSQDAMTFDKPYPWLLNASGVIDILGDPDGEAFYAKMVWGLSESVRIAVRPVNMPDSNTIRAVWRGTNAIPAWSYRGYEGEQAIVEVYSRAETAELFVNGISKGRKKLEQYKAVFDTVYESGTVKAVVYDQYGEKCGEEKLTSATGELHIAIEPETEARQGKLLFVNINLCGENHEIERACDERLSVEVTGGKLLGFGSAAPRTTEDFLTGNYTTFRGRSLAVIRVEDSEWLRIAVTGETNTAEKLLRVEPAN